MNQKDNRRVQMTKQLLRNSLLEMLHTQEIHKISIRTLCQHADVNRSTFYKYYSSQYDLLKDMEDILLTQIEEQLTCLNKNLNDLTRLVNILAFLQEHLELCRMLINSNVDPEFPKRLLYLPCVQDNIAKKFPIGNKTHALYFQDFVLYGGYQMIKRWINCGCKESPEEMTQILDRAFQKFLA